MIQTDVAQLSYTSDAHLVISLVEPDANGSSCAHADKRALTPQKINE